MAANAHGLDVSYFEEKLSLVQRDLSYYTPKEMARELVRLADTADTDACIFEAQRLDIERGKCKS